MANLTPPLERFLGSISQIDAMLYTLFAAIEHPGCFRGLHPRSNRHKGFEAVIFGYSMGQVAGAGAHAQGANRIGVYDGKRLEKSRRVLKVLHFRRWVFPLTRLAIAFTVVAEVKGERGEAFSSEPSSVEAGHLLLHRRP